MLTTENHTQLSPGYNSNFLNIFCVPVEKIHISADYHYLKGGLLCSSDAFVHISSQNGIKIDLTKSAKVFHDNEIN